MRMVKYIRKIEIVTLDPFGYSDIDSTVSKKNWERTEINFT
jgi:hypothetical protein